MDISQRKDEAWLSADEYLSRRYEILENISESVPMKDEDFITRWICAPGMPVLDFLEERFGLPVNIYPWHDKNSITITMAQSLGGKLPVIGTSNHDDFCNMTSMLNGKETVQEYPLTVNAFTMQAKAKSIYRHRLLLLNRAPYSNVPAERIGLSTDDWLDRSYRLRLRHECVHYETLRIFGDMKNHVLDEIAADTMGQIAAFGHFDADKQRLFFGLERGKDICTGRLSFYCQKVDPDERSMIYRVIDEVLDGVEAEVNELLKEDVAPLALLGILLGRSINERMG